MTKYRKAYAYAYPTSERAKELNHERTGCYYIAREVLREDGYWSSYSVWPGTEGEVSSDWHSCGPLRDLYAAIDAPVSPFCLSGRRE